MILRTPFSALVVGAAALLVAGCGTQSKTPAADAAPAAAPAPIAPPPPVVDTRPKGPPMTAPQVTQVVRNARGNVERMTGELVGKVVSAKVVARSRIRPNVFRGASAPASRSGSGARASRRSAASSTLQIVDVSMVPNVEAAASDRQAGAIAGRRLPPTASTAPWSSVLLRQPTAAPVRSGGRAGRHRRPGQARPWTPRATSSIPPRSSPAAAAPSPGINDYEG